MITILLCLFTSITTTAKQGSQITEIISPISQVKNFGGIKGNDVAANSIVTLDFSILTAESWDIKDKPVNMISQCVNGDIITGFKYTNIKIETIPSSYFSEAVIYFSNSNQVDDGIQLAIGSRNENSGVSFFTSNGILDISDSGNQNIVSLTDNKFFIQFYEKIDDIRNQIDARFTKGKLNVYGKNLTLSPDCEFTNQITETDIAVSFNESTENGIRIGNLIDFNFTITNLGDVIANNIHIENAISTNLNFSKLSCGASLQNTESPIINIDTLAPQEEIICTLSAHVLNFGYLSATVTINSDNGLNLNNNNDQQIFAGAALIIPIYTATHLFFLILATLALALFQLRKIKHASSI